MPPTLVRLDGYEHQTLSPNNFLGDVDTQILDSFSNASIDTTIFRTGAASLKINPSAAIGNVLYETTGGASSTPVVVVSIYIRLDPLPSADVILIQVFSGPDECKIVYDSASGKLAIKFNSESNNVVGPVLVAGQWYLVDFLVDVTGDSLKARVDGGTEVALSRTLGTNIADLYLGSLASATFTAWFDDLLYSETTADYPIGAHKVLALLPNADGTHNNPANTLERASDGADINGSTVTAWNLLDEWPAVTTLADTIRQAPISTTSYVEVQFQDTTEETIWEVEAYAALFSAGTAGNAASTRIRNSDGTETVVYTGDMSETALHYRLKVVSRPTGGWTQSEVNAIRARIGFASDANPDPYWAALMLQYAVAGIAAQTISAAGAIGTAEALGALKANFILPTVGALASQELFGSTVVIGPQTVGPAGAITSAEAIGTSKLNRSLGPAGGILSAEAIGAARANLTLLLTGLASVEAFGTGVLVLDQFVGPAGAIVSAEAFGTGRVVLFLKPTMIGSAEAFGVARANLTLLLTAIASGEAFGTTALILDQFIGPAGAIASSEVFGAARVTLLLAPTTITSVEAIGAARLNRTIATVAIASVEAFGTARTVLVLGPSGISTAEIVNAAKLGFVLVPGGIASAQAFGAAVVIGGAGQPIAVISIPSAEMFGILSMFLPERIAQGAAQVVATSMPGLEVDTKKTAVDITSGNTSADVPGTKVQH